MIRDALFRALSVALVVELHDRLRGRDEPTAASPITVEDAADETAEDAADAPIQSDTTAADLLEGFDDGE